MEWLALVMFAVLVVLLLLGYPVAFTLGAVALLFGIPVLGIEFFDLLPLRIWGVMTNFTLLAVREGRMSTSSPLRMVPEAMVPAKPRKLRSGRVTYWTGKRKSS